MIERSEPTSEVHDAAALQHPRRHRPRPRGRPPPRGPAGPAGQGPPPRPVQPPEPLGGTPVTVATHDIQRRAGDPAGSFASRPGRAILVAMTATLTSPTFVGRTEELARLAAAADRAAAGTPTAVLVGGEAGVGKTRLVGELVASARQAGATVLVGGCVELGGEGMPFAPLIEALRPFVRDLDEPGPPRPAPGPGPGSARRSAATRAPGRTGGGCSSCCWCCWSAWAPSARPCWWSRTCTGPTAPPATCSPSCTATCATAGCCW